MRLKDALAARLEPSPTAAATAAGWPENPMAGGACFPAETHAIIHSPAPSVLSAGRRGVAEWVLDFAPTARPVIDPLMGWTGGSHPLRQVRLRFPTREAAVAYARRQGLSFEIHEPQHLVSPDRP